MKIFCDLHIHIGSTSRGEAVKVTGAKNLTFGNIARECKERKGIQVVGIVDCASPVVLKDIDELIESEEMVELQDGGLFYRDEILILPGSEVETTEANGGNAHHLAFFPGIEGAKKFSKFLSRHVTNINFSTQRCRLPAQRVWEVVNSLDGILIPAHAFTPHKSVYGNCYPRLSQIFKDSALDKIPAIELGLSADTDLADRIAELSKFTFLSNSDAHSLTKIGREYNIMEIESLSYKEVLMALQRDDGRRVTDNYGLDPKLGKYHRSFCPLCDRIATENPPVTVCKNCGNENMVIGVLDRITMIQDYPEPRHPGHRPPYHYQVPLEFVPGIGEKMYKILIETFGSEMGVLHNADEESLSRAVGRDLARLIIKAREGTIKLATGGGGIYGKVVEEKRQRQLSLFQ
ncbi:MAG TPA: endonuclease Q family protein [bacterium]|nr:endonuclease Q family protein [bacterium]